VNFDGPATLINSFVDVHITEALNNSLRARLVNESPMGDALVDDRQPVQEIRA
jgi:tRNA-2-methylthio-N6-dimethylallyladenosine synthase